MIRGWWEGEDLFVINKNFMWNRGEKYILTAKIKIDGMG